jgi:hypothetical protein
MQPTSLLPGTMECKPNNYSKSLPAESSLRSSPQFILFSLRELADGYVLIVPQLIYQSDIPIFSIEYQSRYLAVDVRNRHRPMPFDRECRSVETNQEGLTIGNAESFNIV